MRGGSLQPVVAFARTKVGEVIQPGDVVVDATLGNGHDTLHLAQCVGPTGHVFGFDVQEQAIRATQHRLDTAGLGAVVTLVEAGHETMLEHLGATRRGTLGAVMFNLGYLPGGDKTRITRTATTLAALDQAMVLLRPAGLLSVIKYLGHDGGTEEGRAVDAWSRALDQHEATVLSYQFINQSNTPPQLLLIEKRA